MIAKIVRCIVLASVILCQGGARAVPHSESSKAVSALAVEYWQWVLHDDLDQRLKLGLKVNQLADVSLEKFQADARFAKDLLGRLRTVNEAELAHEDWITCELLKFQATNMAEQGRYYWLYFFVTSYSSPIPLATRALSSYRFKEPADLSAYLDLLNKYPAFIESIQAHLKAQLKMGIVLPKPELELVRPFLLSYVKDPQQNALYVDRKRLSGACPDAQCEEFQRRVADVIQTRINPRFRSLVDFLDGEYLRRAADSVGLAQYPSGRDFYRYLVRFHTTLDMTPEEIHRIGLRLVEETEQKMEGTRARLGYAGRKEEFNRFVKTDPRFFPKTPEEMGDRLTRFVKRFEPKIDSLFLRVPQAPYAIERLSPQLEGAQTFGFYQRPSGSERRGIYYFNGSDLQHRTLLNAGVLIFHELLPGHHLQANLQAENGALPDFRRYQTYTGYDEGWASYAASLPEDLGLYDDPYDYYGYLAMNMFYTTRLVVDTGMNFLGWSRAKATSYMREHLLETDAQIATETLRYSVDIPGQALAYRIGARKMLELRQEAEKALGPRFDIRQFHDWVLGSGAMPLTVLEKHIDWHLSQDGAQALRLKVSPNVLVSKDHPELFHAELWFAADAHHPERLMGGSMAYDVTKDISNSIVYISLDGGKTWQSTLKTGESVDPACAYGPDGTAYFSHLNRSPNSGMEIYRSKDAGKTWMPPVVETYLDREFMTIDDTPGKFHGRVYVNAHASAEDQPKGRVPTLFYSTDGGAHFTDYVTPPGPMGFANPGNGVVLSDGTFVSVFIDLARTNPAAEARSTAPAAPASGPHGFVGLVTSGDGGKSLCAPVKIADWSYPSSAPNLSYLPVLAVDRSRGPFRDRLYVAWTDTRSGRGEIYLSRSSDRGRTWSAPKTVNDNTSGPNGPGPDNLHASVAVNKDGVVGVSWYDRRDNPDNKGWRPRFTASLDGGATFAPSVAVSEAAYDPARNQPKTVNELVERTVRNTAAKFTYPRWVFVFNGGDTSNIVADANGDFHVFWTDNRTGTAQVWTSTVSIEKREFFNTEPSGSHDPDAL